MIKFYHIGGKEEWMSALIKKRIGIKSYECLSKDNKVLKRHIDQIVDAQKKDNEVDTDSSISKTEERNDTIKKECKNIKKDNNNNNKNNKPKRKIVYLAS